MKDRIYGGRVGDSEGTEGEDDEIVPRDFADWRHLPSLELERKELWSAVRRALRSMDPIYREVFVLRDMQHLTTMQAAMVLGISEASTTTRLHRARLRMREQLAPFFHKPEKKWAPMQKIMEVGYSYIRKAMRGNKIVRELSNYTEVQ